MVVASQTALDGLRRAIELVLQGALSDARTVLSKQELLPGEPLTDLSRQLLAVFDRLGAALASQELALAAVQSSLWELEAAQENLRLSEVRYRTTLASIGDGLISTDAQGHINLLNPLAASLTGWSAAEAQGRPSAEVFRIADARTLAEIPNPVERALAENVTVGLGDHTVLIARDGSRRQIADSCAPIRSDAGDTLGAVLVFRDVTAEYEQRERLRESEERHRIMFNSSRDAILTMAPLTWRFTTANPAALAMFAVPDEASMRKLALAELSPPKQPDGRSSTVAINEAIVLTLRNGSILLPWAHRTRDGKDIRTSLLLTRMDVNGGTIIQATIRDLTAQQQLEAELAQARKLEAVGQLAAGIAHEINTPTQFVGDSLHFLADCMRDLQALLTRYQAALATLPASPEVAALRAELAVAEQEADLEYIAANVDPALTCSYDGIARISTIVGAMKEFAHPGQGERCPADLNRALENTLTIAKNEYKYVADVITEFGDLPLVPCHLGELNQVFLNLLVNAAHAIAEAVGGSDQRGTITVQTTCDEAEARIEIADTGCGIPPAIQDRVFEPFFTTKPVGRGSGQGLAIARSVVVDKHGGSLTLTSEVGRGTAFVIRLPLEPGATPARHPARTTEGPAAPPQRKE